jgi:phage baseplate assembly protein gpV
MRPITVTIGLAVVLLAAIGSVLVLRSQHHGAPPAAAHASPSASLQRFNPAQTGCAADPHACGFPDATNTGVPPGTALKAVPGQVSSGPGWRYNAASQQVEVTGNHAVLSGLSIRCNLDISASKVTIKDDKVVIGGPYGISLRNIADVTIEDSTVSGSNLTSGRVGAAIGDLYGDSTGIVIRANNIFAFKTAVQVSSGLVTGNYMHDPGYISGDHTNGVLANGGTKPLMIYHNTILNDLSQTDAISIDTMQVPGPVANKTIEDNLLAGGGYPIYGGTAFGHQTSHIVIKGNRFGQGYYPKSGQFGPVAYFAAQGPGNVWKDNIWDGGGQRSTIRLGHDRAGSH